MSKTFKPTITKEQYAERQIVESLNKILICECQKEVVANALEDKNKKENAIKALTALDTQIKASHELLKVWKEFYNKLK